MFTEIEPPDILAHLFADQIDKGWKRTVKRNGIFFLIELFRVRLRTY